MISAIVGRVCKRAALTMTTIDPTRNATESDAVEGYAIAESSLWNEDLAPTTFAQRTWSVWSIAALWISMAACIPTYQLASSLVDGGMNWWQAVITIFLANLIVLVPMLLNAHAGTQYGIPFPVYCRASFGTLGANVPAMIRALVACGWFGIQTWIGGAALFAIACVGFPALTPPALTADQLASHAVPQITTAQFVCFGIFWLINIAVIFAGIESIRILLNIKAPLLIVLGLALLYWAYSKANGFGPMLSTPSDFDVGGPKAGKFWSFFWPGLTGMIGFWATLSLNIPDFSRYAKTQRDQIVGQAIGLPPTMALYSFIGVAVTSATMTIYGHKIWDPIELLKKFDHLSLVIAMSAVVLATLATNIAANVVSPANDFANLAPRFIGFRVGGLITGVIGVVIMPWKLISDPNGYIFTWLIGTSAVLGAAGGVMICDYWAIRKTRLDVVDLYNPGGRYRYTSGFNLSAIVALLLAIAAVAPGFWRHLTRANEDSNLFDHLYTYSWFVTFTIGFVVYFALMKVGPRLNADE